MNRVVVRKLAGAFSDSSSVTAARGSIQPLPRIAITLNSSCRPVLAAIERR